jgi:TonB family protein
MSPPRYVRPVWPLPLALLAAVGCAETATGPKPEIITDCPAAREAEKELAAKEGRRPKPIVQRGRLTTDIAGDRDARPQVTLQMLADAGGRPLRAVAQIHVASDGHVEQVEIVQSSGVRSFDDALVAKIKTWQHKPFVLDCHPLPYIYPMNYVHRP